MQSVSDATATAAKRPRNSKFIGKLLHVVYPSKQIDLKGSLEDICIVCVERGLDPGPLFAKDAGTLITSRDFYVTHGVIRRHMDPAYSSDEEKALHACVEAEDRTGFRTQIRSSIGNWTPNDPMCWIAFHLAVYFGLEDIVRDFLFRNVDVNAVGCYGMTALHWAACQGHLGLFKLLNDAGADATVTNYFCWASSDLAFWNIHDPTSRFAIQCGSPAVGVSLLRILKRFQQPTVELKQLAVRRSGLILWPTLERK